jgi:hypothetical protein
MSGQIQEAVDIGDTGSLWPVTDLYNFVVRINFSLLQNAKVKSWSVMCYEKRRHARLIHPDADAVARYPRLCHFEYRVTNAVAIADADFGISKPLHGEVLSELAESKIVAAQKPLPVMVGIRLVHEYGALLSSVAGEVGLRIAVDIERAHHSPSVNRNLPDRGTDSFAVPRHVAGQADIH